MGKKALITGATAGIGKATALKFASEGWDIAITGRRNEKLESLKNDITHKTPGDVLTLPFDIRDREATGNALKDLKKSWGFVDLLVNNTGLARGLKGIHEGDMDDWEEMIDTNVKGLLYISREVSSWMVERGKGQVVNVGSIAGREVYPKGNVYAATKHAVDALTRAMRIDLIEHNVKVSQVCPGLVNTEFSTVRFHGDIKAAEQVYRGFRPLSGEDVAEVIYYQANAPDHVNIADVLLLPAKQATSTRVHREE